MSEKQCVSGQAKAACVFSAENQTEGRKYIWADITDTEIDRSVYGKENMCKEWILWINHENK